VIFVTESNNEHLDAMASSDMGIVYDGQMVSSAVACHLPTMVLVQMRMHHQWFHDFYNRYWNDMNILADNNINPELIGGEAWYGKICDTLAEWYVKPEIRFRKIGQWEHFLKDSLSFNPLDRSKVRSKDLVLKDGESYDEFKDPFKQVAKHIWRDVQAYELKGGQSCQDFSSFNCQVKQ
jgi:lipid A disaccharide synthetase